MEIPVHFLNKTYEIYEHIVYILFNSRFLISPSGVLKRYLDLRHYENSRKLVQKSLKSDEEYAKK